MPLRPILKAIIPRTESDVHNSPLETSLSNPLPFAACSSRVMMFSPHVHFPTTPSRLTLTGDTHSPGTYDRAPIVVSPNSCALPERGGRVYRSQSPKGSYFHPRAFEACELEPPELGPSSIPPPLLSDLSSETDDGDECVSPQPTSPEPPVSVCVQGMSKSYPSPIPSTHSQAEFDHAFSFLPHPPKPVATRHRSDPNHHDGRGRDGERRKKTQRCSTLRIRNCSFKEPVVAECLGGF